VVTIVSLVMMTSADASWEKKRAAVQRIESRKFFMEWALSIGRLWLTDQYACVLLPSKCVGSGD
jgi:hypothetical protein